MANNKKKATYGAAALALGALLMLSGASIAWLQENTELFTNEFDTNKVTVDLGESKTSFDIVPGTSEEKNPTVTATYTLNSYVYVVVYDNTQNLVDWTMDSSWIPLTDANGTQITTEDGGLVYYQKLTYDGDGTAATFSDTVIEGSTVSYSSALTNADMAAAEDDVTLAFQAYIIQAQFDNSGDASAILAWTYLTAGDEDGNLPEGYVYNEDDDVVYTSLPEAISEADEGETVQLLSDSSLSSKLTVAKSMTIDLNGNTIDGTVSTSGALISVSNSSVELVIEDTSEDGSGVIDGTNTAMASAINISAGSVEFKSGTITQTGTSGYGVFISGGTFSMTGDDAVIDLGSTAGYGVFVSGGSFYMEAGTITNVKTTGVQAQGSSTVVLSGGTIETACTSIQIQGSANVTIKDNVQIICTSYYLKAIYILSSSCSVNIQGGYIEVVDGSSSNTVYVSTSYVSALNITGGTFNPGLSSTAQGGIAEGYELSDNGDGTYSVVASA